MPGAEGVGGLLIYFPAYGSPTHPLATGRLPAEPAAAAAAISTPSEVTLGVFVWLAAAVIVVAGPGRALYNVNWDDDTHLHPDERHMTIVANDDRLPSSPASTSTRDSRPSTRYNARAAAPSSTAICRSS